MTRALVTIDPGLSSGITIGTYSETEPYQRTHAFQIEGGLKGFLSRFSYDYDSEYCTNYLTINWPENLRGREKDLYAFFHSSSNSDHEVEFIVEKFTPRPNGGGSGLKLSTVEPLRIEGALIALGIVDDYVQGRQNPQWVQPSAQYFAGGKSLPEKKKASREFLKKHDLHLTGKMVGCKDADDAISATLHSIGYMRQIRHLPSLRYYFPEESDV